MNTVAILTILVSNMLVYAAPLIFTSIGGAYSEHAGVVNVGLEGIMVMGAFTGVVFNLTFADSLGGMTIWLSLLAGGLVGLIFSAIHAVATINFRADHVVCRQDRLPGWPRVPEQAPGWRPHGEAHVCLRHRGSYVRGRHDRYTDRRHHPAAVR